MAPISGSLICSYWRNLSYHVQEAFTGSGDQDVGIFRAIIQPAITGFTSGRKWFSAGQINALPRLSATPPFHFEGRKSIWRKQLKSEIGRDLQDGAVPWKCLASAGFARTLGCLSVNVRLETIQGFQPQVHALLKHIHLAASLIMTGPPA